MALENDILETLIAKNIPTGERYKSTLSILTKNEEESVDGE